MLKRVKKNDLVLVISGKDKGKQGNIVRVDNKKDTVLVKNIGMVTRHIKAKKSGEKSRISKEESYIASCKVMPICPACKKKCRVQIKLLEKGQKTRVCHRCKEAF